MMNEDKRSTIEEKRTVAVKPKTTVEWVKPRPGFGSASDGCQHREERDEDRSERFSPRAKYAFEREKYSGET